MSKTLHVIVSPAHFGEMKPPLPRNTVIVVFDVLRATSTIAAMMDLGAEWVVPVDRIEDAVEWKRRHPEVLLAGEHLSRKIGPEMTGGLSFDFGNSPLEFTAGQVSGKTVVMKTTNGTKAFRACPAECPVYAGSFLNLSVMANRILNSNFQHLIMVASGHEGAISQEDLLGAGALADRVCQRFAMATDAASVAIRLYRSSKDDLLQTISAGEHARRLLEDAELAQDVAGSLQIDRHPVLVRMDASGRLKRETV